MPPQSDKQTYNHDDAGNLCDDIHLETEAEGYASMMTWR